MLDTTGKRRQGKCQEASSKLTPGVAVLDAGRVLIEMGIQGKPTCVDAKGPCVFYLSCPSTQWHCSSFLQGRLTIEHKGSEITRKMSKERKIGNLWESV